jgi:hypothetical protein
MEINNFFTLTISVIFEAKIAIRLNQGRFLQLKGATGGSIEKLGFTSNNDRLKI